jgi:hypothetical protein
MNPSFKEKHCLSSSRAEQMQLKEYSFGLKTLKSSSALHIQPHVLRDFKEHGFLRSVKTKLKTSKFTDLTVAPKLPTRWEVLQNKGS